ncbi:hypothetical protein DICVIV_01021 [Dictyocaulus viviparus]|uniref:Uncharacterized protein n=1 Tax=Dictyocaulus viviparus TaxID=29172 RepID=A0A0D8YA17_DICVI|nr:hypothetical protein DICVIV_01021 [Dictyocaulus viviparus]
MFHTPLNDIFTSPAGSLIVRDIVILFIIAPNARSLLYSTLAHWAGRARRRDGGGRGVGWERRITEVATYAKDTPVSPTML